MHLKKQIQLNKNDEKAHPAYGVFFIKRRKRIFPAKYVY